jgi:hypothetical protein
MNAGLASHLTMWAPLGILYISALRMLNLFVWMLPEKKYPEGRYEANYNSDSRLKYKSGAKIRQLKQLWVG